MRKEDLQAPLSLLEINVLDTQESVVSPNHLNKLLLEKGIYVSLSSGGKLPLNLSFHMASPHWNQPKENFNKALQHQQILKPLYQPVLDGLHFQFKQKTFLDDAVTIPLLAMLKDLPITGQQVFGGRLGYYDFRLKQRIQAGFFPLTLHHYQEVIRLVENRAFPFGRVSITDSLADYVVGFSLRLIPPD